MALDGIGRLKYEKDAVAPYVGAIGWRSIFNLAWVIVGWVGAIALYLTDRLPLWAGLLLATLFLQAAYMPVHEAVHKTLSGGRPSLAWLDRLVGSVAAWIMLVSFRDHVITHLIHHTHANDERDPDVLNSKGSPKDIVARSMIGLIVYPLGPIIAAVPALGRLLPTPVAARLQLSAQLRGPEAVTAARRVATTHLAVLVVGTVLGYGAVVWLLWYVPVWVGRIWLSGVFAWLPHHPHSETGRYSDTRVYTFPGSTFLIRGHDYHLLHHMFPRVPHYRLHALWRDIGQHLVDQGARIGVWGPNIRSWALIRENAADVIGCVSHSLPPHRHACPSRGPL